MRIRHRHLNSGPWKQKEIPGIVCRWIIKVVALRQDRYTIDNSGMQSHGGKEIHSPFPHFFLSCPPCQGVSATPFPLVNMFSPASGDAASLGQGRGQDLHSRQTWNIRRKKHGRKKQGAAQEKAWFVLHGFSTYLDCLKPTGVTHTLILYVFFRFALLLKERGIKSWLKSAILVTEGPMCCSRNTLNKI